MIHNLLRSSFHLHANNTFGLNYHAGKNISPALPLVHDEYVLSLFCFRGRETVNHVQYCVRYKYTRKKSQGPCHHGTSDTATIKVCLQKNFLIRCRKPHGEFLQGSFSSSSVTFGIGQCHYSS